VLRGRGTSKLAIEGEVQQKDVHARLSKEPKVATFSLCVHSALDSFRSHATSAGHSRDLPCRGFRRDVRIEPAAGRCHQIRRELSFGIWIRLSEALRVGYHALLQLR
jgi:hypothetical protein